MLVLQSTTSSDCGGARYTTHDRERILVSKNVRKKEEKNQKTHEKLPHTHTHTHTKGRHHVPDFSPRISPPNGIGQARAMADIGAGPGSNHGCYNSRLVKPTASYCGDSGFEPEGWWSAIGSAAPASE